MKYKFIKIKDIWYLSCGTIDMMIEHHTKYCKTEIEAGINEYSQFANSKHHVFKNTWALLISHLIFSDSMINVSTNMEKSLLTGKLTTIRNNELLLTDSLSYMILSDKYIIQDTIIKTNILYPTYSESDINIIKWNGGSHYYATIGKLTVEINGKQKWNTHNAALINAKQYLTELI